MARRSSPTAVCLQRAAQPQRAASQEALRDADVSGERAKALDFWPVGEPFPVLLTDAQMRRIFQLSARTFRRWYALGRFRDFEIERGQHRYRGADVARYVLHGDWSKARVFARGA